MIWDWHPKIRSSSQTRLLLSTFFGVKWSSSRERIIAALSEIKKTNLIIIIITFRLSEFFFLFILAIGDKFLKLRTYKISLKISTNFICSNSLYVLLLETLQDRQYNDLLEICSRNGDLLQRQPRQTAYNFFLNSSNVKILWSIRLANVLQRPSIFVGSMWLINNSESTYL